jgi:hypothetical protein
MLAEYTTVPTPYPGIVSPGSKCYAFLGQCEAAGEPGVCVRTLPPDPRKPAILVLRSGTARWFPLWAGTGDQLLLMGGRDPWLINVELDGGDYTTKLVTAGTSVHEVSAPSWNPGGYSDWVKYYATESSRLDRVFAPRLWHRETNDTYAFPIGAGAMETAWSADGRYLVFDSSDRYFVQELIDGELGESWVLAEPVPAGQLLWPFYLQP